MPALVSGQFDLLGNFSQQSKWEIEVIGSVTYQGIKLVILNYPFQISLHTKVDQNVYPLVMF